MRNLVAIVLAVGLSLMLVGCQGKTLVGTWEGSVTAPQMPNVKIPTVVTFKKDGTYEQNVSVQSIGISVAGTFKGDEKSVTMSPDSGKLKITGAPAQIEAMIKEQAKKQFPEVTATLEWKSNDEVIFTQSGTPVTFTRKKESS